MGCFSMQIDQKEVSGGATWFWGAGLVAVLFSLSLYFMDEMLSNSSREVDLGKTLHELRLAQTSVGTAGTVDPRLLSSESSEASSK